MAKDLTVMSVGDVCIGTGKWMPPVMHLVSVWREGVNLSTWLEKVAPVLQQGDFRIANLEAPICENASAASKAGTGGASMSMPPGAAEVLKRAGFDAVAVANNHSMDYGADGLLQTLANLKRAGIMAAGGGRNIREARAPAILERDGVRLAILSYSSTFVPGTFPAGDNKPGIATVAVNTSYEIPGNIFYAPGAPPRIITRPNRQDREKMEEDVRKAKAEADVVVVNWHWGLTRYAMSVAMGLPLEDAPFFVVDYQEEMGRAAVDAGADLVIGHHPHRLQGIEMYRGKVICYSLGTFTMPFAEQSNFGENCAIVKGYIDRSPKQLTRVTLLPVRVPPETMQPYVVPIGESGSVIAELERLSKRYKTAFSVEDGEIVIRAA